jgi:hypothetical protein
LYDADGANELEKFIREKQNVVFTGLILEAMKKVLVFKIVLTMIAILLNSSFYYTGSSEDFRLNARLTVYLFIFTSIRVFIGVYPNKIHLLIPLFITFLLVMMSFATVRQNSIVHPFNWITFSWAINLVIVTVPIQWKKNSIAYFVGMWVVVKWVYSSHDKIPFDIVFWSIAGPTFVTFTNYVLYSNVRSLYETNWKNGKLIKEMKKLLQVFPHGVLITQQKRENDYFYANKEFEQNIYQIKQKLKELDKVQVQIEPNLDEFDNNLHNLSDFILKQQDKIFGVNSVVEIDLKILQIERRRHRRFIEEEKEQNNKENSERSFHVKSLEIEWEGKSSFMHVFIETTNIVKLEEAKTNIKCQKIMFASASHEFRTPLNAIMNSFNFIGDNFK